MFFLPGGMFAQQPAWKPVSGKIMTQWAAEVNPESPLPEYPRPQLVRQENWQSLNGLWQYAITPKGDTGLPSAFDGKILVPYPVESALSGVGKTVGKDKYLWYKRDVDISAKLRNKRLLMHFGAVDWECTVYVNGRKAGEHAGGYDPFSFDISPYLKKGSRQEIAVRVFDPTEDGPQPTGKQKKNPTAIWYTPVTGIWQTVWLEAVPETYISGTIQTPDIDKRILRVKVQLEHADPTDQLIVSAWDKGKKIGQVSVSSDQEAILPVSDPKLWSPDTPFLYDLKVQVLRKGKLIDEAGSYFAMRKISMKKDRNGIQRMMLNNAFIFQYGTLDQGWWPDGLYTAPTDKALLFDIEKTREMGFNMIRKHIKVEPARWYYHCDRMGMLVWQDMPSGDMEGFEWEQQLGRIGTRPLDKTRSAESEAIYRREWKNIMKALRNYPSIVVWVPFNEAWGQFKTMEIVKWTTDNDSSRLVNAASGGNYFPAGHIADLHNYPDPLMPNPAVFGEKQALVLGEFGGLGWAVDGHSWLEKGNFGYQSFKNAGELKARYSGLVKEVGKLIPLGLSAAVYTQITDVEIEVNGLMTYDRKVIKIPVEELRQMHQALYNVENDAAGIVPRPNHFKEVPGEFILSEKTALHSTGKLFAESAYLRGLLKEEFGLTLRSARAKGGNHILLALDPALRTTLGEEGYHLSVSADTIHIVSAGRAGVFYGIQSLRQLMKPGAAAAVSVNCIEVEDRPAFKRRIFMLDEGRYFKGSEVVKRTLDEMALLKMNTFHWHLTEDQGWRIEIKKYPLLTAIGGFRDSSENSGWDAPVKKFDGKRHGGFYTQAEIKEIIRYAAERHIEIIPEIDMPGHSSSAIAAYPWLGTRKDTIAVPGTWGVLRNSYDVADPRVRAFLKNVLSEVMALFPSEIIHIGGDEVDYTDWKNSAEAQQFMKANNLASPSDLQTWFTNDISAFLTKNGRRMMGWNDILGLKLQEHVNNDGNDYVKRQQLAKGTIIDFWLGDVNHIKEAAKNGFEIVNAYHKHTYLNYDTIALPLRKVYEFDPIPEGLEEAFHSNIIGVSTQLWSEYVPTVKEMKIQLFPRLAAIAEVGWTYKKNKNYAAFLKSIRSEGFLRVMGDDWP